MAREHLSHESCNILKMKQILPNINDSPLLNTEIVDILNHMKDVHSITFRTRTSGTKRNRQILFWNQPEWMIYKLFNMTSIGGEIHLNHGENIGIFCGDLLTTGKNIASYRMFVYAQQMEIGVLYCDSPDQRQQLIEQMIHRSRIDIKSLPTILLNEESNICSSGGHSYMAWKQPMTFRSKTFIEVLLLLEKMNVQFSINSQKMKYPHQIDLKMGQKYWCMIGCIRYHPQYKNKVKFIRI